MQQPLRINKMLFCQKERKISEVIWSLVSIVAVRGNLAKKKAEENCRSDTVYQYRGCGNFQSEEWKMEKKKKTITVTHI